MGDNQVNIRLVAEINNDNSIVSYLVFSNKTEEIIYLDKETICFDGKTRRSVFSITDEENKKIKYVGMQVNRIVVPNDYMSIKAGEEFETKIVLSEVYKISKGHKYYIQYSVFHPTYMDDSGFTKLQSNTVEITY